MSFVELGAVTVVLFFAYLVGNVMHHVEMEDPRPFLRKAYWVFVLVEIGAADAAAAVIMGVL